MVMKRPPIKILLIEDDEDDYILVRDLLGEIDANHYQLDWVQNYQDGLQHMLTNLHDVYLIDYRLGAENGLKLLCDTD